MIKISSRNKNLIFISLKIIIAAGLILFLINRIDLRSILTAVKNSSPVYLILASLLSAVNIYFQFLKWKLICSNVLRIEERKKVFYSLFYGFSAGISTPFRLGEYIGRAIPFKDRSITEITLATIIDKFSTLIVILFMGSIAAIIYTYIFYQVNIYITLSLLIILFSLFALMFLLINNGKFWTYFFSAVKPGTGLFSRIISRLSFFQNLNPAVISRILIISFFFYLTFTAQFALFAVAFSGEAEIINYLWAGSLVMFSKSLIPPVSLGELGIREGVSIFFLGSFGVSQAAAFNTSICLFFVNLVLPSVVGLILLSRKI